MFKVLIIAYYYPPMGLSGVQRTLKFTKYLSKYNWEPTVLTTGKTGYFAHDFSLLKEAENANVKIVRTEGFDVNSLLKNRGTIKMPKEWIRKLLSRISKSVFIPDNKKSWANKAYETAKELINRESFDVIYVTIPPYSVFTMAAKLRNETGIPLVVDYRDLWFNNQFSFYLTQYHKAKHKKLEYAALKSSDHIIAVNRRVKEKLITTYKFLQFDDITIIPHGYDQADFDDLEPEKHEHLRRKMKVLYSGIFYEDITPKYFLKAFKKLSIEHPEIADNIELHFAGIFRRENLKLIRDLNLHKFIIDHGYLEHKDAVRKLISSDLLWVMLPNSQGMENVSAGKLFEYFGSRKPILACLPEGASRKAAEDYGASYITSPDNIDEIYSALLKAHEDFKVNDMPKPNEEFIKQHNREALTEQLSLKFQFTMKDEK